MDGDTPRPPSTPSGPMNVAVDYEILPPGERRSKAPPPPDLDTDDEVRPSGRRKLILRLVGAVVVVGLLVVGIRYWLHAREFTSTDDAFIDAHIAQVSPQVAGRVVRVAIRDNQHVKQGDVLVELDARDWQVKLEQAQAQRLQAAAQLEQAQAGLGMQQAQLEQARANLRSAQADLAKAQLDDQRYRSVNPQAVSRLQVDESHQALRSAQARADANDKVVGMNVANIAAQQAQIDAAAANLKAAEVAVANAELQLSYTTVRAPQDGQIARRTVELGNYISPGQALMAVVGEERWVTANFKETQLDGMREGQSVSVRVDACPDHDLAGRVDSFQPGSGQVFSSLPAENATGNYVKVVQRVPVKIVLRPEDVASCRLSPGLSVIPSVKVP